MTDPFRFTGTILFNNLITQGRSIAIGGDVCPAVQQNSIASIPDILSSRIMWQGAVPNILENIILNDLINLPEPKELILTPIVTIVSGQQTGNTGFMCLTFSQGNLIEPQSRQITPSSTTGFTTYTNIPVQFSTNSDTLLQTGGFISILLNNSPDVTGLTLTFNMNVIVEFTCIGNDLDNPICSGICNLDVINQNQCLDSYLTYCSTIVDGQEVIGTSVACQQFFTNYVANVKTDSRIDSLLTNYCTKKYGGFADLFNSPNTPSEDIVLCSCHMQASNYQNYADQIFSTYPQLGNLGINDRCLVAQCATQGIKTTDTGQVCPVPCINVVNFNNNGTFNGSTVINVNQSATCASVSSGGTPPNPSEPQKIESWISKHWPWLLLGIAVIVILIIIILIVIAGDRHKKVDTNLGLIPTDNTLAPSDILTPSSTTSVNTISSK